MEQNPYEFIRIDKINHRIVLNIRRLHFPDLPKRSPFRRYDDHYIHVRFRLLVNFRLVCSVVVSQTSHKSHLRF